MSRKAGMVAAADCVDVAGEAFTLQQQCDTPSRMLVAMAWVRAREAQEYPGPATAAAPNCSWAYLARGMAAPYMTQAPVM